MGGNSKGGDSGGLPSEAKDNLKSSQMLQIVDLMSEGEIYGLVDGLKSIFLEDTPIQDSEGNANFSGVVAQWNNGSQSQSYLEAFPSVENETIVRADVTNESPVVRTITSNDLDRIRVTVGVKSLMKYNDDGDIERTNVHLVVEMQNAQGGWDQVEEMKLVNKKTRSEYLTSLYINDLPEAPFSIRVRRITADSTSSLVSNATLWASYTEIIDTRLTYPNSAVIGFHIDAEQFNSIPKRNYLIRGRLIRVPSNYDPETRIYDGIWDGSFKIAWTDNPAWVFYDLCTCARAGLGKRLTDDEVDKWTLYTLAKHCDELVDDGYGGLEPRFTCNVYLDTPQKAFKVLSDLASIFNGMSLWNGQQVTVRMDIPGDPEASYTHANVIDGKFSYQSTPLKARTTAVHVTYQDPDTYESQIEYISDDNAIARYGYNEVNVEAFACNSRGQARRVGLWTLFTNTNERQTIEFKVGTQGLQHMPGDIFETYDNDYSGDKIGGRVVSVNDDLITLDRDVTIDGSTTFGFINTEGKPHRIEVIEQVSEAVIRVATAVALEDNGIWTLTKSNVSARSWRCINLKESNGEFTISGVEHIPEKLSVIEDGLALPERDDSIYSTKVPTPENLQAESVAAGQVRVTWYTPSSAGSLLFDAKIIRDDSVYDRIESINATELLLSDLELGDYTVELISKNEQNKRSAPATINFTIALPAAPNDIDFTPDNMMIAARPVVSAQPLGTEYEWCWGVNAQEVTDRVNVMGRAFTMTHNALTPDTEYWYGVLAVNKVGKSELVVRSSKTTLNSEDILTVIKDQITHEHLNESLSDVIDDTAHRAQAFKENGLEKINALYAAVDEANQQEVVKKQKVGLAYAEKTIAKHSTDISAQATSIEELGAAVVEGDKTVLAQSTEYTRTAVGYCVDKNGNLTTEADAVACVAAGNSWIDGPLAEFIRNLQVQNGKGESASISNIMEVFEQDGKKLIVRGGMIQDVNGKISGFMSQNDGEESQMDFIQDHFRIGYMDGDTFVPVFYLDSQTNKLVLNGRLILDDGNVISSREELKGDPGVDGTDGLDGSPGKDGTDGTNGVNGAPGADGNDGAPGQDGVDGKDGVDGTNGTDGKNGTIWGTLKLRDGVFPSDVLASQDFNSKYGRWPELDDMLTYVSNDETVSSVKTFNGNFWEVPLALINGNLITKGTVFGEAFVAGSTIKAPHIEGGTGNFDGEVKVGSLVGATGFNHFKRSIIGYDGAISPPANASTVYINLCSLKIQKEDFPRAGKVEIIIAKTKLLSDSNPYGLTLEGSGKAHTISVSGVEHQHRNEQGDIVSTLPDISMFSRQETHLSARNYRSNSIYSPLSDSDDIHLTYSIDIDASSSDDLDGHHYIGLVSKFNVTGSASNDVTLGASEVKVFVTLDRKASSDIEMTQLW
jgi:predicted phage tail protein